MYALNKFFFLFNKVQNIFPSLVLHTGHVRPIVPANVLLSLFPWPVGDFGLEVGWVMIQ